MDEGNFENHLIDNFASVDILKVEAIGSVIGRATAALLKGMTDAGMSEANAFYVMQIAMQEIIKGIVTGATEQNQEGEDQT